MVRVLAILGLTLAVVLPVAAQPAQAPPPAEGPTVAASGEATVKRAPDRAWIQVTAESRARTPREAQKVNSDLMSAVLQKLRGARVPEEAIETRGYDLQLEYDYVSGKQVMRGYLARNTVDVRVDELPRVGELLDVAVSSGATSVGSIRFDLKDRSSAEREALRLAVQDALRRAEALAGGAGMRVDRVLRIEEHRAGEIPPRPMVAMAGVRQGDVAAAPPIEAGELEIRATVTVIAAVGKQ